MHGTAGKSDACAPLAAAISSQAYTSYCPTPLQSCLFSIVLGLGYCLSNLTRTEAHSANSRHSRHIPNNDVKNNNNFPWPRSASNHMLPFQLLTRMVIANCSIEVFRHLFVLYCGAHHPRDGRVNAILAVSYSTIQEESKHDVDTVRPLIQRLSDPLHAHQLSPCLKLGPWISRFKVLTPLWMAAKVICSPR